MATGFITIPTKRTSEVDIIKPIRDFICYVYTDLKPSDYEYALAEFGKLRSSVVTKLSDKTDSALEVLCRCVMILSLICAITLSCSLSMNPIVPFVICYDVVARALAAVSSPP
jgi:hypothetical protein